MKAFYLEDDRYVSMQYFIEACNSCRSVDLQWVTLTDTVFDTDRRENPLYLQFMEKMMPLCLKEIETKIWYAHGYESARVYLFPYSAAFFESLKAYTISLLMDDCMTAGLTVIPQDLCLFRKDKTMFFGSVSHEGIADLYLTEAEEAELFLYPGFTDGNRPIKEGLLDYKNKL